MLVRQEALQWAVIGLAVEVIRLEEGALLIGDDEESLTELGDDAGVSIHSISSDEQEDDKSSCTVMISSCSSSVTEESSHADSDCMSE